MSTPTVEVVPCLSDNYAYILETREGCVVVDPGEARPVMEALRGRTVLAILCTHHHHDHVGGVEGLLSIYPAAKVFTSAHDQSRIAGANRSVAHDEKFELADLSFTVKNVPGHTLGAVTYMLNTSDPILFTGDTLFVAGCGRVFEGTMEMMLASMDLLASLPTDARIYCGHEYTEANLRFASLFAEEAAIIHSGTHVSGGLIERLKKPRAAAEMSSSLGSKLDRILARQEWAKEQRARGDHTMGQTLAEERATNPFLAVPRTLSHEARVECFRTLRGLKDTFRA
ncbi:MAG: hydroxyacylglutathione hydrolase [Polyangiaceae bacterium]|nr:hydroxyacylglutathione hydrolase [Polyangiaceae bacterium]